MTDELKPARCGCGGEAEVLHPSYTYCMVVMCHKCGIKTPYMNSEAEAIEAWNRAMGNRMEFHTVKERTAKVDAGHKSVITGMLMDGHCMQCGRYVMDEDNYCPGCGCRLEWK